MTAHENTGVDRRLEAVMFTDIADYASLTQRDETLALKVLEKHNQILRPIFQEYGGREVKTIGDSFLVEFDSALQAVLCAVRIQSAFNSQNLLIDGNKVRLRIGIHVGDVVRRGGDLFGDSVNIASRIVDFAEEGGVCISEQVYVQVRNKIGYEVTEIAFQHLKHIEQPMNLYQILLPEDNHAPIASQPKGRRIAVLPFANISPDPKDSYFADGLTEELIADLSEVQGLRVIARTSVNRYRQADKNVSQIGNELGVAYLVEGSVRKSGDKIRVSAQLVDAATQEHIWANRYDRELQDIFSIQSDVAKQIVESLKLTLLKEEKRRIEKKGTDNLAAYVAYLKGRALAQDRTGKAMNAARAQFELAIKEDPNYAKAFAGLADIHMLLGDYLFAPLPSSLNEAKQNIEKALELDPDLPEAHVSLAYFLQYDYKFSESEKEFRKAIELNPSYATAHHWYAMCLEAFGRADEGLREVLLAEELDPLSSAITLSALYRCVEHGKYNEALERIKKLQELDSSSPLVTEALMAYNFARKDWDKAFAFLQKMAADDPEDPYVDGDLAYIYAVKGKKDEALKLVEKLKQVPDSSRFKGAMIAFVYSALDDLDECFRWLDFAFNSREIFLGWVRTYPLFEKVREDKRFSKLLERAGLPS